MIFKLLIFTYNKYYYFVNIEQYFCSLSTDTKQNKKKSLKIKRTRRRVAPLTAIWATFWASEKLDVCKY